MLSDRQYAAVNNLSDIPLPSSSALALHGALQGSFFRFWSCSCLRDRRLRLSLLGELEAAALFLLSESMTPWVVLEVSWSLICVAFLERLGLLCYRRSPFLVDCLIGILGTVVERFC